MDLVAKKVSPQSQNKTRTNYSLIKEQAPKSTDLGDGRLQLVNYPPKYISYLLWF